MTIASAAALLETIRRLPVGVPADFINSAVGTFAVMREVDHFLVAIDVITATAPDADGVLQLLDRHLGWNLFTQPASC
jgi:hypothetical protein